MTSLRLFALAPLIATAPVAAQDVPQSSPTPVPLPAPIATPVPQPLPSPIAPTPTAAPTPTPTARPRAVETPATRPSPRPAPSPSPTPTSATRSAPIAVPTPAAAPTPTPTATVAAPPVIASPLPTDDDRSSSDAPGWPWMLGAAVALIGGIGLWLARRQRSPDDEEIGHAVAAAEPLPVAVVADTTPERPAGHLVLEFRPTRVGFNMLSATAAGELTVLNGGAVVVDDVRVRTALLGAHVGQDADLAAFLAEPIGRPDVPAFALRPGESRTVRVLAAAPRAGLKTMVAAGRPMFVPVFAINVRSADGQVAQAFAIGAERVDSAKLAPFWLDVADRTYTEVAARPHGPAVVRQPNG